MREIFFSFRLSYDQEIKSVRCDNIKLRLSYILSVLIDGVIHKLQSCACYETSFSGQVITTIVNRAASYTLEINNFFFFKFSGRWFTTCTGVLNVMVILGFMFNYMLRVNLTIAIVEMVVDPNKTTTTTTTTTGPKFTWNKYEVNEALGSFFWGYILTEVPGGRLAEMVGSRSVFGGGMLAASLLTLLTPASCRLGAPALIGLRGALGFFLGATWPAIPPMAAKWVPPTERSKFVANMMASALGAAVTMPACGYLIANCGWESVFYVTGAIGLAWSVAWFFLVYDSPAQHPRITDEERRHIETKIAEGAGPFFLQIYLT